MIGSKLWGVSAVNRFLVTGGAKALPFALFEGSGRWNHADCARLNRFVDEQIKMWLDKIISPKLGIIGSIASLIGLALTVVDKLDILNISQYIPQDYLWYFLFFSVGVLFVFLITWVADFIRIVYLIPEHVNRVSRVISETQLDLIYSISEEDSSNSDQLHRGLKSICDSVRNNFERYTRDECGVCIKIITLDDGSSDSFRPVVHTLIRDTESARKRENIDRDLPSYEYYKNTAFNEVISSNRPYCYFISNNLKKLEKKGLYQSANAHWHKYYNASIVVPIAATDNPSLEDATGFLCVDNKHGRFNKWMHTKLLSSVASFIYQILILNDKILVIKSQSREPGAKEEG